MSKRILWDRYNTAILAAMQALSVDYDDTKELIHVQRPQGPVSISYDFSLSMVAVALHYGDIAQSLDIEGIMVDEDREKVLVPVSNPSSVPRHLDWVVDGVMVRIDLTPVKMKGSSIGELKEGVEINVREKTTSYELTDQLV